MKENYFGQQIDFRLSRNGKTMLVDCVQASKCVRQATRVDFFQIMTIRVRYWTRVSTRFQIAQQKGLVLVWQPNSTCVDWVRRFGKSTKIILAKNLVWSLKSRRSVWKSTKRRMIESVQLNSNSVDRATRPVGKLPKMRRSWRPVINKVLEFKTRQGSLCCETNR